MNDWKAKIIVDFLDENWSEFESHCDERGENSENIYLESKKEAAQD